MAFVEAKVYSDGSHYIAIPHTERKTKPRRKRAEKIITVEENLDENEVEECFELDEENGVETTFEATNEEVVEVSDNDGVVPISKPKTQRKMDIKDYFEELYKKYSGKNKKSLRKNLWKDLRAYFKDDNSCYWFIESNIARKNRNLICRRIRMSRKANLADFNYFVTFTYDSKLHTEESFRKKLSKFLSYKSWKCKWKYMGVWERSPEKNRLHFHGLFEIPEGTLKGEITEVSSYSFASHSRQITYENDEIRRKFGRNDFKIIENNIEIGSSLQYLMKYIEKTEERIVYSKNLPEFFVSDILDEDVICPMRDDVENPKLLLADNFRCMIEGEIIGRVSRDVIEKMPKIS